MRVNADFILRDIVGEKVLVPTGQATRTFNGLITLNEVATFIWENVNGVQDKEELVQLILENYEVDEATARQDVDGFLTLLEEGNMVEL